MKRSVFFAFAVSVLTLVGNGSTAATNDGPVPLPQTLPAAKASPEDALLSGKVVETMSAGGYTYISFEKNGKKTWIAVPLTNVKVGQEITFQPGTEMGSFTSKTLNRTFENIIFSSGLASEPGSTGGNNAANPPNAGTTAAASSEKISVEKASGPDAYTVSEIYEKRTALNAKSVVVNGKVVKVSQGILGKNWIHIQDGTGEARSKTHKLVVTSDALPAVGDVVTVKGTVSKDKDFGSGYKYDVIIEKASIAKK